MKPTMVTDQRRIPTVSLRKIIASTVVNKVLAKLMAVASASGMYTKAVNPDAIAMTPNIPRIIKSRGNTVAHNVAHNLCCFHPWHAEAARIIKLLRGARAHNVTFMKQPLSAHPTYSVHITMHFSLSMVLNRSRFLSAHCARIISRIIWLDMGPIQRLSSFQREPMCNRWHLGSHC